MDPDLSTKQKLRAAIYYINQLIVAKRNSIEKIRKLTLYTTKWIHLISTWLHKIGFNVSVLYLRITWKVEFS